MFKRIRRWFLRERCYDAMERHGNAVFGLCDGKSQILECKTCLHYVGGKEFECYEVDTKCDKCEWKDQCDLLDITTNWDSRRHYISAMGNVCKKEE